ncbi:glucans biosynthesis protein D [Klebsiella variicola]|uniref:Glucans biosynthesis protein D n=1 Tax=Klebsiella variicola TaxID=244366 RepID=A0A7H4ML81_KLEVA|nr:glucans biosynthesis protein D [Klebsiella variicola]
MFSLDAATQQAREIHFRPELFKYNDAGVDTRQLEGQSDLGFAGFRVFKAPELARRDIVAFLGASYFRAVDSTYQYGLSARGLAVDTFTDTPEEFPDFTSFWFETVKGDATVFTVYALLDSPSITGAYKFTIHCQDTQVIMDVENHLYARKDIKTAGYRADDQYVQLRQQRAPDVRYHPPADPRLRSAVDVAGERRMGLPAAE